MSRAVAFRLETVQPQSLGAPRGYSNGVLTPPGARLLFVAGQIGWGPVAGDGERRIVGPGFAEQFGRALANVVEVVRAAGGGASHIAELTIYVTDRRAYLAALPEVGREYRRRMGRHFPAMALLEVSALVEPEARVEIQAVAALPPGAEGEPQRFEGGSP